MRFTKIVKLGLVSAVICAVALFFLTVAMSSLTVSSAQATPAIAKGKPCGTCHEGSPPSKSNLKKKKK
jgi:hypothetical protein